MRQISFRDGFLVTAKRCSECLFSSAKVVPQSRADEIIKECLRTDTHFICHKLDICCRGFFDKHAADVWHIRLARLLDGVIFVDHTEGGDTE